MFGPQFSRWFTISTSLALAVAIGVIIGGNREPQPATAASATADAGQQQRLSNLEGSLAAIASARPGNETGSGDTDTRLAALQAEVIRLREVVGSLSVNTQATKKPERPDPVELDRADGEHTQQLTASLENAMLSEPVDTVWSATTAAELARNITDSKIRIEEVRCAATLCRIDVKNDSRETQELFFMQLGQLGAFQNSESFMQHEQRADGSLSTVLYVTRAGYPLPGKNPS